MRFLVFLVSVIALGVIGVIGIYLRFFAVLCSLLFNCLKLLFESFRLRLFPPHVDRGLGAKTD